MSANFLASSLRDHERLSFGDVRATNRVLDYDDNCSEPSKRHAKVVTGGRRIRKARSRKRVNAWIAFRVYYSRSFAGIPQQFRSPILASMWKSETKRDLWELLSKTFGRLRDQHGEDHVGLEKFLEIAVSMVPVTPYMDYLERFGASHNTPIPQRLEGHGQEQREPGIVSCTDILQFCYREGIISRAPVRGNAKGMADERGQVPVLITSFASMIPPFSDLGLRSISTFDEAVSESSSTQVQSRLANKRGSKVAVTDTEESKNLTCQCSSPETSSLCSTASNNFEFEFEFPFSETYPIFPYVAASSFFDVN